MALSQLFARVRGGGGMVDIKKLLESAQAAADGGTIRPWTADGVRVGNVDFGRVQTHGRADTLDFIETLKAIGATTPTPVSTAPASAPVIEVSPLLSEEIAHHIADLERRKLSPDTITESKHSLRILLGVLSDLPVAQIKAAQIRTFWDAVRWWPANATVKPQYRDLSVPDIVACGKAEHVPVPSAHTLNKHRQRAPTATSRRFLKRCR